MSLVIYHDACMDGFAAALCARKALGTNAEMHAAQYGHGKPPDCTGKDVYIVDFSYPRETCIQIWETARTLTVLDHHETAERHLSGMWPLNCDINFDMERSGAGMAWDYFHNGKRPLFIDMIEDRDLWRFNIPGSRQLHFALQVMGFDFSAWDALLVSSDATMEAVNKGHAYEDHHNWCVGQFVDMAIMGMVGGFNIPLANAPYWFASDVAGTLAQSNRFAGTFFKRDDKVSVSLRSRGETNVAEIAEQYGGGGHAKASGFQVDNLAALGL